MYCPRCGQQASDEVRFCSRCGLRLDGVTAFLDNEGSVEPDAPEARANKTSLRQLGIRLGAKLIFLSIVIFPIFAAMSDRFDSSAPLLIPLTAFLVGLTRLLYSVIFEEDRPPAKQKPQRVPPRAFNQNMKLPAPPAAVTDSRRVKTADMIDPPSVTENTTNLLKEN